MHGQKRTLRSAKFTLENVHLHFMTEDVLVIVGDRSRCGREAGGQAIWTLRLVTFGPIVRWRCLQP